VGYNYSSGTISNSYATGSVTVGSYRCYIGGLVGVGGTTSNSYYDKETTGRTEDFRGGTGKTTAEMKTQSIYEGWDFGGIWEINPAKNNSYPILLWQNSGHIASAIVSTIPNQTWTGSPITPKPSISFKGNNLIEGTDFEYAYDNNTQIGNAILKIVGRGSYSGQQANITGFRIIAAACGTGFAGGTGTEDDPYKIADARNLDAISNCSDKYYELQKDIDLGNYIANASTGWQPIGSSGKFNGNGHKVSGLWINRPAQNRVGLFGYVSGGAELRNIGVEIDDGNGGVRGYDNVGGLVGGNDGTISNSYATGSVTVVSTNNYSVVGGLVGRNERGTISNSYATGSVTGSSYVGGLVGRNERGTVSNSYATGSVTGSVTGSGNYFGGGLVGQNEGTVSNSYATGSVTGSVTGSGNYFGGGLVGQNVGTISNSYATGSVTGRSNVGGLVGGNDGTISNSYYDKETSGRTDTGKGIGKTTAEMKTKSTYNGWDFEAIWEINPSKNNGYPILLWQNPEHIANAIVSFIPNQTWTGSPITPKPSISFKGNNLIEGTHFEYFYSDNTQIGNAILKIVGRGSYSGQQANITGFRIIAATCGTGFAGGTGTEDDPYKIAEARNLDAISNCLGSSYSDKYYELQKDIDLGNYIANASTGWQPIGSSGISNFSGKFNGNGHKVSGLWINRPLADDIGLFGYIYTGAEIRNIGVEIDDGNGGVRGYDNVGGLVGSSSNGGTISNSYATGNVTGSRTYVGGLVGHNYGATINSYATGSVTGRDVGGLVGHNYGATINSYATGSVTGRDVGGLVGYNSGTISNSYYDKETSGRTDTGKGIGKTTAEMKTQNTYEGWDFENTWTILSTVVNKGYPILQWQAQGKTILEGATISSIPSQTYTGSTIEPAFTVTFNGATLTKNTDYSISYSNNRNAGTAKITVNGIGTYLGLIEADFTITAKPVTITDLIAINRDYNGTTTVELTGELVGVLDGDEVDFIGTGTIATPDVGNNIAVTNITLAGTDAGNYTLTQPVGVTANITPKPITITGVTATYRIYDNGKTVIILNGGTLNGVLTGDAVGFILGTGTVSATDASTNKAVTTNITLTGTAAPNYTLTQPTGITVTIYNPTPIFSNRANPLIGRIGVQTKGNTIILSNLPQNAKVEVYNLQGKLIRSTTSHSPLATSHLKIEVQTKGIYIIKAGTQTMRVVVR